MISSSTRQPGLAVPTAPSEPEVAVVQVDRPPPPPSISEPGPDGDLVAGRGLAPATVVARAQDGDVAAFGQLVRTYQAELLRLAYRMLADRGEAQDVVQEALLLVWRKLPTLADPQAFHAWIYHLTTRQCLNVLRARTRRRTDLTSDGELEPDTATGLAADAVDAPAAAAESSSRRSALDQILATIPADQRACWVLHELHDLSYPEISYVIGAPVSTVRGRIARARQQLARGMTAWR